MSKLLPLIVFVTMCSIAARPRASMPSPPPSPPQPPDGKRSGTSALLAHPFLLLVMTVLLSGLLAPVIIGEVQAQSKEIELKSSLVTQMSETSATYIAFQSVKVLGAARTTEAERLKVNDDEYQTWVKRNESIRSQLSAYVIDDAIDAPDDWLWFKWSQYGQVLLEFSNLNDTMDHDMRVNIVERLDAYFSRVLQRPFDEPSWVALHDAKPDGGAYRVHWIKLRRLFLQRNAELVEMVMRSCTRLRTPLPWIDNCKYYPLPPLPQAQRAAPSPSSAP